MEIIVILLVILLAISLRAYLRQRALARSRLDKLNEKARKANPPPEPDILSGTGRLHPNGSVYYKLSDGRYGSPRDDGSVFTVPEAEYYTGEPLMM
mgnify:CR=1 FL=1